MTSRPARPRAITLIAWLFIAVGTAGLLKDLWPLATPQAAPQIAKLKADGFADLGPAWTSRLLAIVGGAFLLRGFNWARWLLVVWMGFHIVISALHSPMQLLIHCVIFTSLGCVLFHPQSSGYFRRMGTLAQ